MDSEVYYAIDNIPRPVYPPYGENKQCYKKIDSNGEAKFVKVDTPRQFKFIKDQLFVIDNVPRRVLQPDTEKCQLYKKMDNCKDGGTMYVMVDKIKPLQKDNKSENNDEDEDVKKKKATLLDICLKTQTVPKVEKKKKMEEINSDASDIETDEDDD